MNKEKVIGNNPVAFFTGKRPPLHEILFAHPCKYFAMPGSAKERVNEKNNPYFERLE
ncbi:hypothetical protein [Weizmannia acidilactici]|uniref:hypothetical protein n=1 Tax=Weizmannia acidilactici TaxID=2607726 RepID=UPI001562E240|nr:hypothetical protein [Weizmannia acidilactici]